MEIKNNIKNEINLLKNDNNKSFSLALLFTTIILFIYCYFGSFSFFEKTFTSVNNLDFWKIIYHNTMAFLLFFIIGIIFTKLVIKSPLSNFGLRKGKFNLWIKIVLIAIPFAILCGLSCLLDKGMCGTYPLVNLQVYNSWYYVCIYFLSYILYYIGWEYLFRGVLYFSSEEKCGTVAAILITTLISALIHTSIASFGKPMVETLSAIPAGIIFGCVAHKSRSIYPSLLIHIMIGFATDLFILFLA